MSEGAVPSLHLPEQPSELRRRWWDQVAGGVTWDDLLAAESGPAGWLWSRWLVLESAGMRRKEFTDVVGSYRRELWLWLVGDRRWEPCCAGLIGRLERRLEASSSTS